MGAGSRGAAKGSGRPLLSRPAKPHLHNRPVVCLSKQKLFSLYTGHVLLYHRLRRGCFATTRAFQWLLSQRGPSSGVHWRGARGEEGSHACARAAVQCDTGPGILWLA